MVITAAAGVADAALPGAFFLLLQEFNLVAEFVDPDQSGSITREEWLN